MFSNSPWTAACDGKEVIPFPGHDHLNDIRCCLVCKIFSSFRKLFGQLTYDFLYTNHTGRRWSLLSQPHRWNR